MIRKFTTIGVLFLTIGITTNNAQSIFANVEEVAAFLVGEWNIDVVQGGFAGGSYYLPSAIYYDSTVHRIVFETTEIDSTPLRCKAYIADTLYQETFVMIKQNPSQIILPRWQLFNVPDNLEANVDLMEEIGFYGFSQDTITLSGYVAADGFQFGLSRIITNTKNTHSEDQFRIFPNPSSNKIYINGLSKETLFELYNMNGELIDKGYTAGQLSTNAIPGTYIIRLFINHSWKAKKIILAR